jgi:hypothetical protein
MWKDIEGYEGLYQISDKGEVKSLPKEHRYGLKTEKILKPKIDKDGYYGVSLCKNGKSKSKKIHRLVAQMFINNPNNKPTVNHINAIVNDNTLSNLEWATHSEQNYHLYKLGLKDLSYMSKLIEARWK